MKKKKLWKQGIGLLTAAACLIAAVSVNAQGQEAKACEGQLARVSVHDPSIVEDKDGTYYVMGSHIAAAKSEDLCNWTQLSTDYQDPEDTFLYGNLKENLTESFQWAGGYDDGDHPGGYAVWAPDVIYNPAYQWADGDKGAYMLYYCASSTWRRSCIGYMVSKTIDGKYQYADTLVYSGFTNTGEVTDDGNSKIDTTWSSNEHLKEIFEKNKIELNTEKWFNEKGEWNNNYAPNAIDPCIFFDASGQKMYMTYGSWSGGIFILELDPATGQAIYPGKDGTDQESGNTVDRFFGTHIAGGNHQSGEGPYILYDKEAGYYYLYETYGGLTRTGGYNMRLFRSKNVYGPYLDAAGNNAKDSGADNYKYGIKLIGNYQFLGQPGYMAAGHNSALINSKGNRYLVHHQRFADESKGEYHEVRVRQQFLNEDKWPVAAVYENRNESIGHYDDAKLAGDYEFINHGSEAASGDMLSTEAIRLEADGKISGDQTGSWKKTPGDAYDYVTLTIGDTVYKGVFFEQTNDLGRKVMTFTAIGNNNQCIWGSSYEATDQVKIQMAMNKLERMIPSSTREDLDLPADLSGVRLSWKSSKPSVIATDGTVTSKKKNKSVTLTASFDCNGTKDSKTYHIQVYKKPRLLAAYDFEKAAKKGKKVKADKGALVQKPALLKGSASLVKVKGIGRVCSVKNQAGARRQNYLSLPGDIFKTVTKAGYTVSMKVKISEDTFEHSALFEGDMAPAAGQQGTYPMTRIGANMIARINANGYSDVICPDTGKRGQWEQVTYCVDTKGIRVYLDGKLIGQEEKDLTSCFDQANAASVQKINQVMAGAGDIWNDEDCRNVLFDQVAVYDSAMTAAEAGREAK